MTFQGERFVFFNSIIREITMSIFLTYDGVLVEVSGDILKLEDIVGLVSFVYQNL